MTLLIIMNGDSRIVPHVVHLPYNLLPSNVSLPLSLVSGRLLPLLCDHSYFPKVYRVLVATQPTHAHRPKNAFFFWICHAAPCRTLWNLRNKFMIKGFSLDVLYKMSIYLQVWKPVLRSKRQNREALEMMIGRIHALYANVRDRPEP
jgi:hypothetical protein